MNTVIKIANNINTALVSQNPTRILPAQDQERTEPMLYGPTGEGNGLKLLCTIYFYYL